jgi:nucleotide-binding universal stress UspA family protein
MRYCQTNKKPLLMNTLETKKRRPKFVSIKKVLVAVDLSEQSEATTTYAAELAKYFGASLTLVHVHDPVPLYEYASETTCTVLDEQREDLQRLLNELTQRVRKLGLVRRSVFLDGDPAERISALAGEIDADLIVTGSRPSTFLGSLLSQHKAPQIMHRAPCPVLIYHQNKS